jgi:hypothetical protein
VIPYAFYALATRIIRRAPRAARCGHARQFVEVVAFTFALFALRLDRPCCTAMLLMLGIPVIWQRHRRRRVQAVHEDSARVPAHGGWRVRTTRTALLHGLR